MNRKIVIFSATVFLVFCLTACDNQQVKNDESNSNTLISEQETREQENLLTNTTETIQTPTMEEETSVEITSQDLNTEVETSTDTSEESTDSTETQNSEEVAEEQSPEEEIINEPVRYVLPQQENYWVNHYFDLEGYLTACGLTDIEVSTTLITAHLRGWEFEITTAENDHFPQLYIHREGEGSGLYYEYDYDDPRTKTVICVNADELIVHQATVDALADPIAAILYFEDSTHEPDEMPEIRNFVYE